MGRRTYRFCAHSLLRALPNQRKSPANLQEAGLLPFEIIELPEQSCKWPHFFVKAVSSKVHEAKKARLSHPFVVVTMRLGKICGMGCTSDPSSNEIARLQLPFGEPNRVRWSEGHARRDSYVALDRWFLNYSELLFENERQPKKIGAILDRVIQAIINSVVVSSSQTDGEQP